MAQTSRERLVCWLALVENTARGWGLKDPWDEPYVDMVDRVRKLNKSISSYWAKSVIRSKNAN